MPMDWPHYARMNVSAPQHHQAFDPTKRECSIYCRHMFHYRAAFCCRSLPRDKHVSNQLGSAILFGTAVQDGTWSRTTWPSCIRLESLPCLSNSQLKGEMGSVRERRQPAFRLDVRDSPRNEHRQEPSLRNLVELKRFCEAPSGIPHAFVKDVNVL